jgi:hypothetical protein
MNKIALVLLVLSIFSFTLASANENVVYSTGFEDDAWSPLPQNWSYVTGIVHSGQRSLHVNVPNSDQYTYPTQSVPCQSGGEYTLSFYVKTEDVIIDPAKNEIGAELGATACIQYRSSSGEWLGGQYEIQGLLGTNDWTKITYSFIIPENLGEGSYVTLSLYLRKGLYGKAWFDDVQITEKPQPILLCRLFSPKYRTMHFSSPLAVKLLTSINLTSEEVPFCSLTVELRKLGESWYLQKFKFCNPQRDNFLIECDIYQVQENIAYELVVSLINDDNQAVIEQKRFNFINISEGRIQQTTLFDEKGNLVVNGEPFFPLGWFVAGAAANSEPSFAQLKAASFNVVMNYNINSGSLDNIRSYLDLALSYDLKILYSLKDFFEGTPYYSGQFGPFEGEEAIVKGLVSTFKDHSAILGWYISDELKDRVSDIELHNKWVWEADYKHPTWLVSNLPQELKNYDIAVDILGVDPYPVPDEALTQVSDWVNLAKMAQSGNKPVWAVIQAHGYIYYGGTGREPTIPEIKAMSYLALVNGAKGLLYYSLFDLEKSPDYQTRWESIALLNREILDLTPVFLHGERVKLYGLVEGFEGSLFEKDQERYLIIVNYTGQERELNLDLTEQVGIVTEVQEKNTGRILEINGNILRDTFAPFAVHIYSIIS